ncbi:MAG: hypothetical protein DRJ42_24735 [Deltaproteobacteria bacterium]|nr:MAG: hypothetical protein DRJ42_24735 [Deltaproteobacteria bacterium]
MPIRPFETQAVRYQAAAVGRCHHRHDDDTDPALRLTKATLLARLTSRDNVVTMQHPEGQVPRLGVLHPGERIAGARNQSE